jgi:hypothetical protein
MCWDLLQSEELAGDKSVDVMRSVQSLQWIDGIARSMASSRPGRYHTFITSTPDRSKRSSSLNSWRATARFKHRRMSRALLLCELRRAA